MSVVMNILQGQPAFDIGASYGNALFGGALGNVQADQFTLASGSDSLVFAGTFSVSQYGVLLGGTITGFQLFDGSTQLIDLAGFSIDVALFQQALDALPSDGGSKLSALLNSQVYTINGSQARDTFGGGNEGDRLFGNAGDDHIDGNEGNDFVSGGTGLDHLIGGAGSDTVDYSEKVDALIVTLKGGLTTDVTVAGIVEDTISTFENVNGGSGNDSFTGDAQVNRLLGNGGDDKLIGGDGNDILFGGQGRDTIVGGSGNDFIHGGRGNDVVSGGADSDTFFFDAGLAGGNVDTIAGFAHHIDVIALERHIFTGMGHGSLKGTFFHVGAAAHDADDHVIYNAKNGALFYDKDGIGGVHQVKFAQLAGHPHLDAGDFLVF